MKLMKCGHVANSYLCTDDGEYKPACAICTCTEVEKDVEDSYGLEGRTAKCCYCNKPTESSWKLPFFEYKPDKPNDRYYCGCYGWD